MSANKNAQLRYRILDRCLKDFSRMYGIDDLTDAVNESFLDLYGTTISTRTIRKDLNDLQDRMSFNAPRIIGTGTTDSRQITNQRTYPYDPGCRLGREGHHGAVLRQVADDIPPAPVVHEGGR